MFLVSLYPHSDTAAPPSLAELEFFGGRKRKQFLPSSAAPSTRPAARLKVTPKRIKRAEAAGGEWQVVGREADIKQDKLGNVGADWREDEDSAFESDQDARPGEWDCPMAAFLPPQQALWTWADSGWKVSPKSRRVQHGLVRRGQEELRLGDCAVFRSTGRPDTPYIGQWSVVVGGKD